MDSIVYRPFYAQQLLKQQHTVWGDLYILSTNVCLNYLLHSFNAFDKLRSRLQKRFSQGTLPLDSLFRHGNPSAMAFTGARRHGILHCINNRHQYMNIPYPKEWGPLKYFVHTIAPYTTQLQDFAHYMVTRSLQSWYLPQSKFFWSVWTTLHDNHSSPNNCDPTFHG